LAKAGTIFFPDVDALPLEAQSVLLNVLELGFIQRIGSQRAIEVDVRVIASTSARMETLLTLGSFRPDLYYRLTTFAITIPPLRERSRDIPLVVDRILRRLSLQLGYPLSLGQGVLEVLKRYSWPGNVREIESVLGRAATQVKATGVIELTQLPSSLRYVQHVAIGGKPAATIQSLSEVERATIIKAAQLCRGNVTQMARALGISRATLWRHLKALDIDAEDYRQPHLPSKPSLRT
jgi:transcriptional activator for dhaKLM operon